MSDHTDDIIAATIEPNPEDLGIMAVNRALRDESVDITTKFMAHVKNRLRLTDIAFQNIQTIQLDLMTPENYAAMTTQEKLKFLQVLTTQMQALGVPLEDQKITFNQINTQINNAINSDKAMITLPRASRDKLRGVVMDLVKTAIGSDTDEPDNKQPS
jgi:hypothetical protein